MAQALLCSCDAFPLFFYFWTCKKVKGIKDTEDILKEFVTFCLLPFLPAARQPTVNQAVAQGCSTVPDTRRLGRAKELWGEGTEQGMFLPVLPVAPSPLLFHSGQCSPVMTSPRTRAAPADPP